MKLKTKQVPLLSINTLKAIRMNLGWKPTTSQPDGLIIKKFQVVNVVMKLVSIHGRNFPSAKSGYERWKQIMAHLLALQSDNKNSAGKICACYGLVFSPAEVKCSKRYRIL